MALQNYIIAAAPFGGPIALLRDEGRIFVLQSDEDTEAYLTIYNGAGVQVRHIAMVFVFDVRWLFVLVLKICSFLFVDSIMEVGLPSVSDCHGVGVVRGTRVRVAERTNVVVPTASA